MRIFVTGASGWIGSSLVPELLDAGHEVVGLARSEASAQRLETAGVIVQRGDLDDPAGLAKAAAESDGVVHLAFQHEVAFEQGDFAAAARSDRRAVEAMGDALAGSDRPFVLASGVAGLSPGRTGTEGDGLLLPEGLGATPMAIRQRTALLTLSLAGIGVRSSVVRFAPTVHGAGDKGFIAAFVQTAHERGVSGYVGEGGNRWPAVHVSDAGRLVRLAVESAPAGSVLHAVAEEGVVFRDVAEAIGRQIGVPTASVDQERAVEHFGFIGLLAGMDMPASSAATRQMVGWEPTGPALLNDLDAGRYAAPTSRPAR